MKNKDLQKIVFSKYQNGDGPTKIFRDLGGGLCLKTIKRWCKMIDQTGSINLSSPSGCSRIIRTATAIQKVKNRMKGKKTMSVRKLSNELNISRTSIHRILTDDLGYYPYKKVIEPFLTDAHKAKRKKFANWVRTNFRKEQTMKILFSDEKLFDIDGVYNSQNDRVWAPNRAEANKKGGIKEKRKFPQKVMVWLGACSKGITPLVIFEEGTLDHARYIKEVLPVALEYGNKTFGNDWTFQQDGAKPHIHHLTQQWCRDHFPAFLEKDRWPANSPDLNPLDYCIWDELANAIDWHRITSKKDLIEELKRATKKVRPEIVFESCNSWTSRLLKVATNDGNYLDK
jgi:inhibitor of nuclear factor kappa-B kinase subunit alpha